MDITQIIQNYIKPELLVVSIVLYFVGMGMKKTEKINDKFSTYNESLHVTSEDKKTGLTAYRCAKRLWICN